MSAAAAPPGGRVLDESFYERSVLDVSRDLIGCALLVDGVGGVIVETEAYRADEPACHAYVGLTARSAPLFGPPGHAYVYLSYGVHSCFNVVAEPEGSAAATLVRAIEPRWGIDVMRERRGVADERRLCAGPGMLTQALGIGLELNTRSLGEEPFELRGPEPGWAREPVAATPRVGITKAIELDWRYCASSSRFLSRPLPRAA